MKIGVVACGLAAMALVACSSGSFGVASSDPFVGTWSCTGTDSLTATQPTGVPPQSNSTSTTRTIVDNGDGTATATATATNDAGAMCALRSKVSGSMATLESGQSCALDGFTLTFTSGTGSVSGSTLTLSASFTFAGTVTTDAGQPIQVAGVGTTSSTCMKQQ